MNETSVLLSEIKKGAKVSEKPYYVMLPCEINDFNKFVAELLGKPQELKGEIEGTFEINHTEISNFYHLLQQRMSSQHGQVPINFIITVFYSDGTSATHNNIPDFERYIPITLCHPVSVLINAVYLIKFEGRSVPEKQEVEVFIATKPGTNERNSHRWFSGGLLEYSIRHTERTWATDIAGLITSHSNTIMSPKSGIINFLSRYGDDVTYFLTYFVMALSVIVWANHFISLLDIDVKEMTEAYWKNISIFTVKSIAAVGVLFIVIASIRKFGDISVLVRNQSYIVFNEKDRISADKKKKANRWEVVTLFTLWIFTILTGVLTNIIYNENWFW